MLAGGIRSDELASETPGESPHNDQRQKSKPLKRGFCFLWRERACSRVGFEGFCLQNVGESHIYSYKEYVSREGGIRSDEQASGMQGVSPLINLTSLFEY
jgi:hypothetical protein